MQTKPAAPPSRTAPQTDDGVIVDVSTKPGDALVLQCEFVVPAFMRPEHAADPSSIVFAARSRFARLGIDLLPLADLEIEDDRARLLLSVNPILKRAQVLPLLSDVLLPGLPIGRLVACPRRNRLTAEELIHVHEQHELQLPADFSITTEGDFAVRSHRIVYEFDLPLTQELLLTILGDDYDGRELLNRIQKPRVVDHIVLPPGEGVITTCSMFLHKHYVVIAPEETSFGRHLHAIVLDPVSTRGSNVFLEIVNHSATTIVNPTVFARVYRTELDTATTSSASGSGRVTSVPRADDADGARDYGFLEQVFATCNGSPNGGTYFDRPIAILRGRRSRQHPEWHQANCPDAKAFDRRKARLRVYSDVDRDRGFATRVLTSVPKHAGATLAMKYFPNFSEHLDILAAARVGKISQLVFNHASFEHGPFLSARDHARLADYEDLGIEVLWFNDARKHVSVHTYRGRRGFFCDDAVRERFRTSLIFAFYGSSRDLAPREYERLTRLIGKLREFFGPDMAVVTGGGPGAMEQAETIARADGLLTGASYLEIESGDRTHFNADFYQVFQSNCRHQRLRWFEVASFPIISIGGVGTVEEIGATLTDLKLGVSERVPVVFFGQSASGSLFWDHMRRQFRAMHEDERLPEWLFDYIVATDDPDVVVERYRELLQLS